MKRREEMPTFDERRSAYVDLWNGVQIKTDRKAAMEAAANKVAAGRRHYEAISAAVGVPWWFIGFLHLRESDCNFSRHLHNGDPLTAKTRLVPANRPPWKPRNGKAYTFEESAEDALGMKGLHLIKDWSVERILYEAERYNGWGYAQYRGIPSPYVWGGTNKQKPGKYVADGVYSPTTWDVQPGVAAVLKILLDREPDLLGRSAMEEEAIAAPKADYKPETHQEAHTLLKDEKPTYSLWNEVVKKLGLPLTLGGASATGASASGAFDAWMPAISFFKDNGWKLALAVVVITACIEGYQYLQRRKVMV